LLRTTCQHFGLPRGFAQANTSGPKNEEGRIQRRAGWHEASNLFRQLTSVRYPTLDVLLQFFRLLRDFKINTKHPSCIQRLEFIGDGKPANSLGLHRFIDSEDVSRFIDLRGRLCPASPLEVWETFS
jgi:hypothetical protein